FGVQVRTIERRRHKECAFAAAMKRGKAKGRISLRRQLYIQAIQHGNIPALLFLAKNQLGLRDGRSNEPGGPNTGRIPADNGPAPAKKFDGSLMELLALYRRLSLEEPLDEG